MNFVNPPAESPNVTHKKFFSQVFNYEIGYIIYFPPGHKDGVKYPVVYHIHGGWAMNLRDMALEKVYKNRRPLLFLLSKFVGRELFRALFKLNPL